MDKKYIVLDTETTGLNPKQGHRIIEIAAIVIQDRKKLDEHFHTYLNPEREIDVEAQKIHNLSLDKLINEPKFHEICDDFIEFITGSTLIMHNAQFDLGFLNEELYLASSKYPKVEDICDIEDTIEIARKKFPNQKNNLDALARRLHITEYDRTYHGALVDANITADAYLLLTGGQTKFEFQNSDTKTLETKSINKNTASNEIKLKKIVPNKSDIKIHNEKLKQIEEGYNIEPLWKQL